MNSRVRIIGGKWRGRKLPVVDAEGLRPTPDRIRETLFNWLAADCRGARVLDCFAGSGALGFEALSRGARTLTAIERSPPAASSLRRVADSLDAGAIEVVVADAVQALGRLREPYDIVFIDPPYAEGELRARVFLALEAAELLRPGARVYFEWPAADSFDLPSGGLEWLKRKRAGQVDYAIAEWRPSG